MFVVILPVLAHYHMLLRTLRFRTCLRQYTFHPQHDWRTTMKNAVMRRRDFIRAGSGFAGAAAVMAAGCSSQETKNQNSSPLDNLRSTTPSDLQGLVGDGRRRRILLRGGVVLSLD